MKWDEIEEKHQEKLRQRLELAAAEDSDSDPELPADINGRASCFFSPRLARNYSTRSSQQVVSLDSDYSNTPESKSAHWHEGSGREHADQSLMADPAPCPGWKVARTPSLSPREEAPPTPMPSSSGESATSPGDTSHDQQSWSRSLTHNFSAQEADSPKDQDNTVTASASISSNFSVRNPLESNCYLSGYDSDWEGEGERKSPAPPPEIPAPKVQDNTVTVSASISSNFSAPNPLESNCYLSGYDSDWEGEGERKSPAPPPEIPAPKEPPVPVSCSDDTSASSTVENCHPEAAIGPPTCAVPRQSVYQFCQLPHPPPPPPSPLGYQQYYEYRGWTLFTSHMPYTPSCRCGPSSCLSYGRHSCSCCSHDLRSSAPPPHACTLVHPPPTRMCGELSCHVSVRSSGSESFGHLNCKTALEPCSCCCHNLRSSAPPPYFCAPVHPPPTTCGEPSYHGSVRTEVCESLGRLMTCKRALEPDDCCPNGPQRKRCCGSL